MVAGPRAKYVGRVFRRVWKFVALFVGLNVGAALTFFLIESPHQPLSALTAFYWAIVTISTTGYGDITPKTTAGLGFTTGLLYAQIFLVGYLFSVITGIVTEESQARSLGILGTALTGHIVVVGYTPVGRAAVRELLLAEQKVAVIADTADEVHNLRALAPESQLYATYGRPAEAEILRRANVPAAHSVIVCLEDDAANLIAALNVRALGPNVRIVVSISRPELEETLKAAGVTYIASPSDMGGRLCADAAFRPDVAQAIDDLTETELGADMEEFLLSERAPIAHQTVAEAEKLVRQQTDCQVIGYARKGGDGAFRTILVPPLTTALAPGDALIVIGSVTNLRRLSKWLGVKQGR
ncbi:MAG TPA: NAD-binding protein [Thermoplasmata archaeon]|nr:NAD-binding protein [Thermoplasmata archaeon]